MRLETVTKNPPNLGHSDVTNMRENMEKWGGENIVGVMHLMASGSRQGAIHNKDHLRRVYSIPRENLKLVGRGPFRRTQRWQIQILF